MKTNPVVILPLVVAVILIVYGRVNHRNPRGNMIAIVGYATLAATFILALLIRG